MGKHQVSPLVVIEERVGNDMSDVDRFASRGARRKRNASLSDSHSK